MRGPPSRSAPVLLIATLAFASAGPADAEVCSCTNDAFSISSLADSAPWSACTAPDPTDDFVISDQCQVTVLGDLHFAAGGSWTVRAGGTTLVQVTDQPVVWTMPGGNPVDEFHCQAGSTCRMLGGYRSYGRSPATVDPTQSRLPGRYFRAGVPLPCPHVDATTGVVEPRCGATSGNERLVQFRYPAEGSAGDPFFAESLGAIGVDEIVCLFDPDPADATAPPDVNYCYWITRAEVAPSIGDSFLEFEVTQQSRNDPADNVVAPVALRESRECVLQADVPAGASTVECASDFIARDGERAGQWIWLQQDTETCGDGDATPCRLDPHPYRIARTRDGRGGGPDEIELLDVRGVARSFPDACDAGAGTCRGFVAAAAWLEDDPLSIWVPVILRSGTTGRVRKIDEDDSSPRFSGGLELRSVAFDGTGRVNQDTDLVPLDWEDVAMFDLAAVDHAKVRVFTEARGQTGVFGHTMVAGTSRCSEGDTTQSGCPTGVEIFPGETCVVAEASGTGLATFRDLALRHCGGKGLALNLDDASFVVERLRFQFRANGPATPGYFLQCQGSCQVVDAECIDCANVHVIVGPGDWDVDDLLVVGGQASLAFGIENSSERLRNATLVGLTTTGVTPLLYGVDELQGFVLRDGIVGAGQRIIDTSGGPGPFVVRNSWIAGSLGSRSPLLSLGFDTTLENVAIVDTDRSSGPCTVVARSAGAGHLTLRNLILGWSFGRVAQCDLGLAATLGAGQTAEYADLLVTNFSGTALSGSGADAVQWSGDLCTANDAVDFSAEVEQDFASMSPDALPRIVRGRFTLGDWPAVTCGLAAPAGVTDLLWTHVVNRIEPEFADPILAATLLPTACGDGVDNDGDGLIDYPNDPGCLGAGSALENPQCDDDLDNDGDGRIDWNGPGTPDPQCAGSPWRNREARSACGLGAELALLVPLLRCLTRRRGGRGEGKARPLNS